MKRSEYAIWFFILIVVSFINSQNGGRVSPATPGYAPSLIHSNETRHFDSLWVITHEGTNAEAYFSPSGNKIILQSTIPEKGINCDQMFIVELTVSMQVKNMYRLSNGEGKCTCGFFAGSDDILIYSSTMEYMKECPVRTRRWKGKYVWNLHTEFEIYLSDVRGNILKRLTNNNFYDAEGVVSPDGKKIVFTSTRSGDIDIWIMNIDGGGVRRLTSRYGYEGGPAFSPDGSMIVFRAYYPRSDSERAEYTMLLRENLVAPSHTEIYIMDTLGKYIKQVTNLGGSNWAPYFHPSGKKIIFSSNHKNVSTLFPYHLYMIDTNGNNLEQITYLGDFNAFPMFNKAGDKLIFTSNRVRNTMTGMDIIVVKWKE